MPIYGKEPPWGKTRYLFSNNGVGSWLQHIRAWVKVAGKWEQVFGPGCTIGQVFVLHLDIERWYDYVGPYGALLGRTNPYPSLVTDDWVFGGGCLDVSPVYDSHLMGWIMRNVQVRGGPEILDYGTGDFSFDFRYKFSPEIFNGDTSLQMYNLFIDGFPGTELDCAWPRFAYLPPYSGKPSRLSALENTGADGGPRTFDWTPAPVVNQWYHLALARYNGVVSYYVDGVEMGSYSCSDRVVFGNATGWEAYMTIGSTYDFRPGYSVAGAPGKIDEFRAMNGVSGFTGPFTPPVASYGE